MPGIDFTQILISFAVLVLSLSFHEAAHAWSAERLGDRTARMLGRVSLNPAVHVDPIGTILFPLVAMVTGVPVLGWAKPVPVDSRQLGPSWKQKFMVIAAAGPASNLVIATICAVVLRILAATTNVSGLVTAVLSFTVDLNIVLAVFNMVPVPPLDGGNVLAGLLRGKAGEFYDRLRPYGFLIVYVLLLSGALWTFLNPIRIRIESFLLY